MPYTLVDSCICRNRMIGTYGIEPEGDPARGESRQAARHAAVLILASQEFHCRSTVR
jgi:hypothetical protein